MMEIFRGALTGLLIVASPTSLLVFALVWIEDGFGAALNAFHDLVLRALPRGRRA